MLGLWIVRAAVIAAALFASTAHARSAPCQPIAGLDAVLARPNLRFLMIGEVHGTVEIPHFVGEAVCAAARRRPVTLVLELKPQQSEAAIAVFLNSNGGRGARQALMDSILPPVPDGRSSEALVDLISRARELKRGGADIRIMAYDPIGPAAGQPEARETAMAEALEAAAKAQPDRLFIVHTGAFHARKLPFGQAPTPSVGQRLNAQQTVSLEPLSQGGVVWGCTFLTEPQPVMACKPAERPAAPDAPTGAAIQLGVSSPGYDGRFTVGGPFHTSPLHGAIVRTSDQ